MPDPAPKIEERPDLGVVFDVRRFDRPSSEGVARGFQLTGWWDFPRGGFKCSVERGLQKVRIDPTALDKGDAGIERHFAVQPGDVYRLTARLRVASKTGKFKGRVNLAARRHAEGKQVEEFNDSQDEITDTAVERVAEALIPPGAEFLSVRVKFHTSSPGESGEGEIHSMRLERVKESLKPPAGPRVSLYNFNIHKMEDDWRGWIRFIKDQRLTPPDVVLLQDIEHDADREVLQKALGEAFGGGWTGRGSHQEWQVAILWRAKRFSQPTVRTWLGFGGDNCADGSQDAPAIQVKLHDEVARKWISLVSLKTPPQVPDDCAGQNVRKVDRNFAPPWAGDLCVIGTDANSPANDAKGEWVPWYRNTVASKTAGLAAARNLGFCDPVADVCGVDRSRMEEHLTLPGKGRVDFLLLRTASKKPPLVVRQMTLPRANARGVKWSDHRCVHAEVAY